MKKYLISAAAVALLGASVAWADPPADRGNRGHDQQDQGGGRDQGDRGDHGRGAPAPAAPAPQAAAPQAPAPQASVQAPPNRGGGGGNFGRGFDRGGRDRAPQVANQAPQPQDTANRGGFDRGGRDRGPAPQMAIQTPPNRDNQNRGGFDRRGPDNRNAFNDNRGGGDFNRDGRTNYRSPGYGGQRHNFTGFRDYHRDFRAAHRFQVQSYRRPAGWYSHRWNFGEFLPAAFWARDYWLIDFADYDLPPPPYGAVWVRVDRDALLIDEDSGEIITVAYDVFY